MNDNHNNNQSYFNVKWLIKIAIDIIANDKSQDYKKDLSSLISVVQSNENSSTERQRLLDALSRHSHMLYSDVRKSLLIAHLIPISLATVVVSLAFLISMNPPRPKVSREPGPRPEVSTTPPLTVPETTTSDRESPALRYFRSRGYPRNQCGDQGDPNVYDFYPVYVRPINQLNMIIRRYCRDAYISSRGGTRPKSVQVGSFIGRERASSFKEYLESQRLGLIVEVGEPN